MKKEILFLLLVLGIGAWILPRLYGETTSPCESFGVQVLEMRKEAPLFTLKSLSGIPYSLKDFKGKPVLMMFWATWCPSCLEELPAIDKSFKERQDPLVIFLLAVQDKEKRVRKYVEKNKINLPVLLDKEGEIALSYFRCSCSPNAIPAAFLIDREGRMIAKIIGERDWCLPVAWSAIKELLSLR